MVEVEYEVVGQPLLTIQEAIKAGSFFGKGPGVLTVGDAKGTYMSHYNTHVLLCILCPVHTVYLKADIILAGTNSSILKSSWIWWY